MQYPKFSIVIPVKNGNTSPYNITRLLDSIICQTYKNYEIIVMDAKSTDGTQKILKKYSARIKHWESKKDGGIVFGMNKGMRMSTGDFILTMGSDCYVIDKDVLKDVATEIRKNPGTKMFNGKIVIPGERGLRPIRQFLSAKNLKNGVAPPTEANFFAKDMLEELDYFDEKWINYNDLDLYCRFVKKGLQSKYINRVISFVDIFSSSYVDPEDSGGKIITLHFGRYYTKRRTVIWKIKGFMRSILRKVGLLEKYNETKAKLVYSK